MIEVCSLFFYHDSLQVHQSRRLGHSLEVWPQGRTESADRMSQSVIAEEAELLAGGRDIS